MGCRYKSHLQLQARIARRRAKTTLYEIENILSHRVDDYCIYYLVQWRNYTDADNTWEHENEFQHAQEALKRYWTEWAVKNPPSIRPRAQRFRVQRKSA